MTFRVHIVGASGSGTTTLGLALASRLEIPHFDIDDYYWIPTDPPYREPRPSEERLPLLEPRLRASDAWVLSGSLVGWGNYGDGILSVPAGNDFVAISAGNYSYHALALRADGSIVARSLTPHFGCLRLP